MNFNSRLYFIVGEGNSGRSVCELDGNMVGLHVFHYNALGNIPKTGKMKTL